MIKELICVECPKGCKLSADIENNRVAKVSGNECPKGERYAVSEIENPRRVLTAAVTAQGLSLRMLPARTDKPIPKQRIFEAMEEIRKLRVDRPVRGGDVILKDLLGLGINLIATRDIPDA
ncbi:MAG: DUF1667 domain-containing protein [Candidatus Omnitrophota bacterium]